MPLYEYQCDACGCRYEELVSASSPSSDAPACPSCLSREVTRILSAVCGRGSDKGASEGPASGPFPSSMGCGSGGFS